MKFYVKSQDFEVVLSGEHLDSAENAACEAFLNYYKDNIKVSPVTIVSERGFCYHDHDNTEDKIFDTVDILRMAGFKFEE